MKKWLLALALLLAASCTDAPLPVESYDAALGRWTTCPPGQAKKGLCPVTPPDTVPDDTVPPPPPDTVPTDTTPPPPPPPPPDVDDFMFVVGPQSTDATWPQFHNLFHENAPRFSSLVLGTGWSPDRNYYDMVLSNYEGCVRYGDSYCATADSLAALWWATMPLRATGDFTANGDFDLAPRSMSAGGLLAWGLRGHWGETGCFPQADGTCRTYTLLEWVTELARAKWRVWIRPGNPSLHYGIRDGAYALLLVAQLARVHPDPLVQAEMRELARRGGEDYYAPLQYPDGGFYWYDSSLELSLYLPSGVKARHSQPFMNGLLADALIYVHQVTGSAIVQQVLVRQADWLIATQRIDSVDVGTYGRTGWRGTWYTIWEDGAILPPPTGSCSDPVMDRGHVVQGTRCLRGGSDPNSVRDVRQNNCLTVHAFGYAYRITGDPKYREAGDEIFAATFGKSMGPMADWAYALPDYQSKQFNQCYRSSGHYLAWRS